MAFVALDSLKMLLYFILYIIEMESLSSDNQQETIII